MHVVERATHQNNSQTDFKCRKKIMKEFFNHCNNKNIEKIIVTSEDVLVKYWDKEEEPKSIFNFDLNSKDYYTSAEYELMDDKICEIEKIIGSNFIICPADRTIEIME